MYITFLRRKVLFGLTTALTVVASPLAMADTRPSLNFYGAAGLIDMPSGEAMPDGLLTATTAHFGPISRSTLSFQITPRMSASFRFVGIRDWDNVIAAPNPTYYDRSFDFRYLLLREGQYLPSVTIGLQDFAGTGILSGEYVAATKNLTPNLKVTAGLGWGRLGSEGAIGAPFGTRGRINIGKGGKPNYDQWFRGDMAPFGGVEWRMNDRWTVKAEYSSDAYKLESDRRKTFNHASPFNFGLEYSPNDQLRLGAYYMYGDEVGISAQFFMNPKQRPAGGVGGPAPAPVKPRPARSADPDAWSPEWIEQDSARALLISNTNKWLEKDGIIIEAMGYDGRTAQVRIRNTRYDAEAQAIGRTARALSQTMPASIEVFEIVPLVKGMPASKVSVRRSELERLEFTPGAGDAIRASTQISAPGRPMANLAYDPEIYPKFTWSLGPYNRIRLFDQIGSPFKMDVGLRLAGKYEVSPGFVLEGMVTKKLVGNLDSVPPRKPTGLQPVRSDNERYDSFADPGIEKLMATKYAYLGGDVYGRVSAGYLERMFAGVSGEVLWKPADSRWALGAEMNYVAQRDTDGGFGFSEYDYSVASGHLSAYYQLSNGFHAQLDVGRYLAGDVGATLSIDREFENGWRVGGFATITNVSEEDFGSGSFDKGIRLEIPFAWGTGQATRNSTVATIRPFGRDGGARLEVDRLYDQVRDYHTGGLDEQWGRFWK
jgi:hypothetical protein